MKIRSRLIVVGLTAALSPAAASAQDGWTGTVSVFGGGSAIPTFSADVTDPTLGAQLEVRDRKLENAAVVGGSVAFWHGLGGGRLRGGIRGDVSYQPAKAEAQTNPATGTLLGLPYDGPIPVAEVTGSVTLVTGAALLGWDAGRVMPYIGAGGGAMRATAEQLTNSDTSTSASWSGIAGIAVKLNERFSAHGEYRYTVAEPTIVIGTQTIVFKIKPSQFVAGLSLKF